MTSTSRRLAAVLAAALAVPLVIVGPAAAGASVRCEPTADYNSDGYGDVAAGVPGEKVGDKDGAGAVSVVSGGGGGLSQHDQLWHFGVTGVDGNPGPGEGLGSAVASGDFNGDGRDDLAMGAPRDGSGSGSVAVLFGSSTGLRANAGGGALDDQRFTQGTSGIADTPESGDGFGAKLAAGDFNGDGRDDLAIGVPTEDLAGSDNVGGVEILYGGTSGLTTSGSQFLRQGVNGVADAGNPGDRFGLALASCNFNGDAYLDLAIGAPFENVSTLADAGAVHVIYGSASGLDPGATTPEQFLTQATVDLAGDGVQANDHFGLALAAGYFNDDAVADLAVGVPDENLGAATNAGGLHAVYGDSTGTGLQLTGTNGPDDQFFTQNSTGVDDSAEQGDHYAKALAAGDFDDDGIDSLAIGAPDENIGGVSNAGLVNVIAGTATGLDAADDLIFHQALGGFPGEPETDDRFGAVLGAGDYGGIRPSLGYGPDDLGVGVPAENIGSISNAGTVVMLYGSNGLSFNDPLRLSQEGASYRGSPNPGDRFGASVT